MKKLLIGILATLACFACFAGCNKDKGNENESSAPSTEQTANVEDAKKNVKALYQAGEQFKKGARFDYEVVNAVNVAGVPFSINWTVTCDEGVVTLEKGDVTTKVVVNKALEEDATYTLTATITAPDGTSTTLNFEGIATKAPGKIAVAISSTPVEGVIYKLYTYQGAVQKDCYINGKMKNTYFLDSVEDFEKGIEIFVETVSETDGTFNMFFNAENADQTTTKKYINVVQSGTHYNAKYQTVEENATPTSYVYNTDFETITTELDNKTFYFGADGTYTTIEPQYETSAGYYKGYLVTMVDKDTLSDEYKVEKVKDALSVQLDHKVNKEVELTVTDERFPEVTISWELTETTNATLTDNKLALTIPAEAATVTLTAKITKGEVTDTKEFVLNVGPAIVINDKTSASEVVAAAFSLAKNETLPGGTYTLTGVITKVNTEYNAQYGNVTVTILVDGTNNEIECYRMVGTGVDTIAIKDTITVTGTIKNFNGKVEFDKDCTLDSYTKYVAPAGTATISFAEKTNRTEFTTEKQVWVQNGITVTNEKAGSSSNVADYADPARFYKNSSLKIECAGMKTLSITCGSADYAKALKESIAVNSAYTINVDGSTVVITFVTATDSFTIDALSGGQVRIASIEVTK